MARPKADLESITVPKIVDEPPPAPAPAVAPIEAASKSYAHTLSLRLTAEDYRGLRRYVAREEDRSGRRVSHQALLEGLLRAFLAENSKA